MHEFRTRYWPDWPDKRIKLINTISWAAGLQGTSHSKAPNGGDVAQSGSSATLSEAKEVWRHLGYTQLDFPFIQLPLSEEKNPRPHALWIRRHAPHYLQRKYLSTEEVRHILEAANYFRQSNMPTTSYAEYSAMMRFLQKHSRIKIIEWTQQ